MTTHEVLHIIRNPWGWSEDEVRAARLAAADLIEQQQAKLDRIQPALEILARVIVGEAVKEIEQQAKQVEVIEMLVANERAREALKPFADIGAWLFARNLPDDTPLVEVLGLNGAGKRLTRGHFKAAYEAEAALSHDFAAGHIDAQAALIEQQAKRIAELERLNLSFAQNEQKVEQQAKQIEALRGFAQEVMNYWPEGWGMEGDQIQKAAADHGLLEPETRTERCGENCGCDIDAPVWVCYRKTKLLTGQ